MGKVLNDDDQDRIAGDEVLVAATSSSNGMHQEEEGDEHKPATASGSASIRAKENTREETRACDRKTCARIWLGPLGNCQVKNAKPLGTAIFFSLHLHLGVGKQQQMPNKNCQTIGGALTRHILQPFSQRRT